MIKPWRRDWEAIWEESDTFSCPSAPLPQGVTAMTTGHTTPLCVSLLSCHWTMASFSKWNLEERVSLWESKQNGHNGCGLVRWEIRVLSDAVTSFPLFSLLLLIKQNKCRFLLKSYNMEIWVQLYHWHWRLLLYVFNNNQRNSPY